jgi:Flp pilus assembly protein TadD
MGWNGEAGIIMERLAGSFPRDPLIQVNYGMVLARAGGGRKLADAAVAAKRALSLSPGFAPAHTCLGIIASLQGRTDAAERHLTDAIRLSDTAGYRNQGLLACARGLWEEAETHLLRATRLDPLDARAWAGLGAAALHAGKTGEAILLLRRACSLDPRDSGPVRGLAIALAKSGDLAGAEEVIRRALDLARDPRRWLLLVDLAALLISRGGPAENPVLDGEARQVLTEAEALRPDEPGILFYEGVAEARLGNPKAAIHRFTATTGQEEYRIPSLENIRRLKGRMAGRMGFPAGIFSPRSALALLALLQLAAAWSFFVARLVSEGAFLLLVAIFSVLFALILFVPARNSEPGKETPLELVIPKRTFVPSPVAEMVPPFIRLRTSLRPRPAPPPGSDPETLPGP